MNGRNHIAVVGAGISGLAAAFWLEKSGNNVTVFEKSSRIGGTIITEQREGFQIDLGPNSTLETSARVNPNTRKLASSRARSDS